METHGAVVRLVGEAKGVPDCAYEQLCAAAHLQALW